MPLMLVIKTSTILMKYLNLCGSFAIPYVEYRSAGSKRYLANPRSTMKSKIILKYKFNNDQFLNLLSGHESIHRFDPHI